MAPAGKAPISGFVRANVSVATPGLADARLLISSLGILRRTTPARCISRCSSPKRRHGTHPGKKHVELTQNVEPHLMPSPRVKILKVKMELSCLGAATVQTSCDATHWALPLSSSL